MKRAVIDLPQVPSRWSSLPVKFTNFSQPGELYWLLKILVTNMLLFVFFHHLPTEYMSFGYIECVRGTERGRRLSKSYIIGCLISQDIRLFG